MRNTRRPNSMLIELVIVILFFAISASIILQLFVAAHEKSVQSAVDTAAVLLAEDHAERFAASREPADAYLEQAGFTFRDGTYASTVQGGGRQLTIKAVSQQKETEAGTLDTLSLTIYDGKRVAVSLPATKYMPKEVTP